MCLVLAREVEKWFYASLFDMLFSFALFIFFELVCQNSLSGTEVCGTGKACVCTRMGPTTKEGGEATSP